MHQIAAQHLDDVFIRVPAWGQGRGQCREPRWIVDAERIVPRRWRVFARLPLSGRQPPFIVALRRMEIVDAKAGVVDANRLGDVVEMVDEIERASCRERV